MYKKKDKTVLMFYITTKLPSEVKLLTALFIRLYFDSDKTES